MAKNYKTIALTGTEQKVVLAGQNCDIRNDSVDIVYASSEAGITSGADGVLSIPAGQAAKLLDCRGTLYILGTGSVMLCGNDYSELVFKTAATSSGEGGGTVDEVARQAISSHANNDEIHLTAEKAIEAAATTISNPNILINSWLGKGVINQRGKTEYVGAGYNVDGWSSTNAAITIMVTDSGLKVAPNTELTANTSVLQQKIMSIGYIGRALTVSANITQTNQYAYMQIYALAADNSITGYSAKIPLSKGVNSVTIAEIPENTAIIRPQLTLNAGADVDDAIGVEWIKLEVGTVATPFTPPDPATELVKCQRYYYQSWEGENPSTSGVLCIPAITKTRTMSIDYPVEMAKKPTIMICTSDGAENAVKAWSSGDIVTDVATHYVSTKRFIVGNESSSFVAGAGYGFHYSASAEP